MFVILLSVTTGFGIQRLWPVDRDLAQASFHTDFEVFLRWDHAERRLLHCRQQAATAVHPPVYVQIAQINTRHDG